MANTHKRPPPSFFAPNDCKGTLRFRSYLRLLCRLFMFRRIDGPPSV
jgi:hypothetical protein